MTKLKTNLIAPWQRIDLKFDIVEIWHFLAVIGSFDQVGVLWKELSQRLSVARHDHAGVFIPDDFVQCNLLK